MARCPFPLSPTLPHVVWTGEIGDRCSETWLTDFGMDQRLSWGCAVPWTEGSIMSFRAEFVMLASGEGANVRGLCRSYGISAQTGYKWLSRAASDPEEQFANRSRRPRSSPGRTPAAVEAKVVALRSAHPRWGGRKLAHRLHDLGEPKVPAPSTITEILCRHGRLDEGEFLTPHAMIRFERERPNELW
jgi:hypothetical protein